jgi:hypothetical protein
MPRKRTPLRKLRREARAGLRKLALEVQHSELLTKATLLDCRKQIVAITRDLLPHAAALARRGRPRLLAICQKVLSEQSKPEPQRETTLRIRR